MVRTNTLSPKATKTRGGVPVLTFISAVFTWRYWDSGTKTPTPLRDAPTAFSCLSATLKHLPLKNTYVIRFSEDFFSLSKVQLVEHTRGPSLLHLPPMEVPCLLPLPFQWQLTVYLFQQAFPNQLLLLCFVSLSLCGMLTLFWQRTISTDLYCIWNLLLASLHLWRKAKLNKKMTMRNLITTSTRRIVKIRQEIQLLHSEFLITAHSIGIFSVVNNYQRKRRLKDYKQKATWKTAKRLQSAQS